MRNLLLFVLLLSTSLSAISQINYKERIEIQQRDGYNEEKINDFGEFGLILSSRKEESIKKQKEWKYELYNSDLKLVKTENIMLNEKLSRDESYSNKERMHTLYKDKKGNYSLVSVEASTFEIIKVDGVLPKKTLISGMEILGDYAFFKASLKKSPFLFSINWKTGMQNTIPVTVENVKPKQISLMDLQLMPESNVVFLYIKALLHKKESAIHVVRLNDKGEKEMSFNLTKNIDKNIISVTASKLSDDKYIYTGTYSTKSTGSSEGMFFCEVNQEKVNFIEFHNFLGLENFLSYLPERKQKRIEKKKDRKEEKGKELKINYHIAPHEIVQLDDGYILLGEAYYPTYRTTTYTTTTMVNGMATTTTHTQIVFDGYQYTHAMMAKFDKTGKLMWDEIFEMWQAYKPFFVKKFISVAEKNQNSLKLAFASRNKIYSKEINYEGSIIHDFESEEIETPHAGDKSKWSFSNISYWYDNYFIAYGNQKIKNKGGDEDVKRKRKVYFVSKIEFN